MNDLELHNFISFFSFYTPFTTTLVQEKDTWDIVLKNAMRLCFYGIDNLSLTASKPFC